jgi:hypothetical protein
MQAMSCCSCQSWHQICFISKVLVQNPICNPIEFLVLFLSCIMKIHLILTKMGVLVTIFVNLWITLVFLKWKEVFKNVFWVQIFTSWWLKKVICEFYKAFCFFCFFEFLCKIWHILKKKVRSCWTKFGSLLTISCSNINYHPNWGWPTKSKDEPTILQPLHWSCITSKLFSQLQALSLLPFVTRLGVHNNENNLGSKLNCPWISLGAKKLVS